METQIIQQIRSLTNQLHNYNSKLAITKNQKKIKALLKQNDILVKKRIELAKKIGLASWEEIYGER